MPTVKLISLAEAVRRYAFDGMQYASGAALPIGSDAIIFGRELLRQKRTDLHAVFHANSQQLNLLAAAGAVSKAECGFSGLEVFGFANGLRRAVERGQLLLEDYSNLAMPLRLLGGALNWPFVPATVNIGSDLQDRSAFAPRRLSKPNQNSHRDRPVHRAGDRRLPPAHARSRRDPCHARRSARKQHHARHRMEPVRAVAGGQARRGHRRRDRPHRLHAPVSEPRAHSRCRGRRRRALAVRGVAAELARHVRPRRGAHEADERGARDRRRDGRLYPRLCRELSRHRRAIST